MTNKPHRTLEALEAGRLEGWHRGGQVYASIGGSVEIDLAFGEARDGEPMRSDHRMLWLSSGKPITAVAIARLWEQGRLELDDPVARHIPEFGAHGKHAVTVRHLLTHTGGIRTLRLGWPEQPWAEVLQNIYDMKLEPRWEPGQKAGYHLTSSWFVLAEIIQRLTDSDYSEHVRREIFEPLEMNGCWIGMPTAVFAANEASIAPVYDTAAEPPVQHKWTNSVHLTTASPGSNGNGPFGELAHLYEMLLGRGQWKSQRIISSQTVDAMVARQRVGLFDHTFRQTLDWGLGFVLDSRHYGEDLPTYGYGLHASTRVFGHSGYRSSTAFADPKYDLVVALGVNGTPSGPSHRQRFHSLISAVYEDLQLTTT